MSSGGHPSLTEGRAGYPEAVKPFICFPHDLGNYVSYGYLRTLLTILSRAERCPTIGTSGGTQARTGGPTSALFENIVSYVVIQVLAKKLLS